MKRIATRLGLVLSLVALAPNGPAAKDPAVGKSYKVPYRLTLTNHYLVRVRINGKGPFNFLVDTGAPALYIGTEAAKTIGLAPPPKGDYWTPVERLDLEGGATLKTIKARVEDPFQLEGMNALGLPGARIDGILGFTILARFRMEFDPTNDRMTWTRLDYEPPDPFVPRNVENMKPPAEMQMMSMLGPAMKFASLLIGKQPEDILQSQGLLGLELSAAGPVVRVADVWKDSPAAKAGVKPGDELIGLAGRSITTLKIAHEAIALTRPGDKVKLTVKRGGEEIDLTLTAAEGL